MDTKVWNCSINESVVSYLAQYIAFLNKARYPYTVIDFVIQEGQGHFEKKCHCLVKSRTLIYLDDLMIINKYDLKFNVFNVTL